MTHRTPGSLPMRPALLGGENASDFTRTGQRPFAASEQFGAGRVCASCPAVLSAYNPDDLCRLCMVRAVEHRCDTSPLNLVCGECGHRSPACDCPASVRRSVPLRPARSQR